MAQFSYLGQSDKGTIKGLIEATDRPSALAKLREQNIKVITIEEAKEKLNKSISFKRKKVKKKELVVFTRQFSTMVSAGVPIVRTLNTLSAQLENAYFKEVLGTIVHDVEGGAELADALAKHPDVFNDIYVNMVRAGEAAGILDDILKRLALQQEKAESIRKKVKSASTYPAILLIITVLAFFGLMFFVIPQIGKVLTDLGGPDAELPAITQAMLAISDFMLTYWYLVIGALVGVIIGLRFYFKTTGGRSLLHHTVLKIPVLKDIIGKLAVARFARTYASLIAAGVSVLEALRVTGNAVGNVAYQAQLLEAAEEIKAGKSLSAALSKGGLFPPVVPQMLAVGEETGKTDQVLVKVADFYEEEVDAMIEGLSSIIEPVMIVVMGGMVGLVAISVMGPIASLSQNIQG